MSDDGKTGAAGQNSPRDHFNRDHDLEERLSKASPDAIRQVQELQELSRDRTESEFKNQRSAHKFRVNACRIELLEKYISEEALRPDSARKDPAPDLQIIAEEAERRVTAREQHYLDRIEHDSRANIDQVLHNDERAHNEQNRSGQDRSGPDHDRDDHSRNDFAHEPDHEREQ